LNSRTFTAKKELKRKVRKTNKLVGENELWGNMPEAVKGFVSPCQN